jgi:hypothetical protein
MGGAYSTCGEMRNAYKILVEKLEWKRPLRKRSCIWKILEWILKKLDKDVVWIHLVQEGV